MPKTTHMLQKLITLFFYKRSFFPKDIFNSFEYKGKIYKLVFNLNVMQNIQEKYGTIAKWGELTDGSNGEPNAKAVIFGFTEMINEAIDIENEENNTENKFLTEKQVGRIITSVGLKPMAKKLSDTVIASTESGEKTHNPRRGIADF